MRVMQDKVADIDEPGPERMRFRTNPPIKRALQKAAALSGMDDTTFAMKAAGGQAFETIRQHEIVMLKPEDYEAVFEALDNPPPPNAKLKAAFERHRRTMVSK